MLAAVMAFAAASTVQPGPQLFVFDEADTRVEPKCPGRKK
jgi:hypothetical protein